MQGKRWILDKMEVSDQHDDWETSKQSILTRRSGQAIIRGNPPPKLAVGIRIKAYEVL
jgi:hypothetical protein